MTHVAKKYTCPVCGVFDARRVRPRILVVAGTVGERVCDGCLTWAYAYVDTVTKGWK